MKQDNYQPLDQITRSTVTTDEAAFYLNRRPQTLRIWSMEDSKSPIKPIRINGRLAWKVSDIKSCVGL